MTLRHEAAHRLRMHRRSAAVIGIARWLTGAVCLFCGCFTQHLLSGTPALLQTLYLPAAVLVSLPAVTPLRMQTDWQIGRIGGTLDENDLGFLGCSSNLWLWRRAIRVQFLQKGILLLSAVPMCLLWAAAGTVWALIPESSESILPLLTVLHLLILTAAAVCLPLRTAAAAAALPFSFLKMPHESPLRILRMAFHLTRGQTAGILMQRLLTLPFLLLPFTAAQALPVLLCAEQMRSGRAWRRMQPHPAGFFSRLELHAAV